MFKLTRNFGPKPLQEIHQQLVDQINAITPVEGVGIDIDYGHGAQISLKTVPPATPKPPDSSAGGGAASGTTEDIYGSLNGSPALFHVLVSAPAEPL